mgnify:CR=1 FL=1
MDQTARRRRRNLIQNIAIALLSVSAVLLFAQLQLYNLGTSEDPLYLERLTGEGSPSRLREFPAPVRVVLTDSYGRYGSLGFTTNSDGFSALGLREALGSVQHLAPSTTDAFRGALSGPSIYFDFLNPLPLQVLAELTGAEGTALEGNARCLLLAAGADGSVHLYVWDGADTVLTGTVASTALSIDSLTEAVSQSGMGSVSFAFEVVEMEPLYGKLFPLSILPTELPQLPVLSAASSISGTDWLLAAFGFNINTRERYAEADGTEVITEVEADRSLHIRPSGEITYRSGTDATLEISAQEEVPTAAEAVLGASILLEQLTEDRSGEARLYLESVSQGGDTTQLLFGYQIDGVPIRFSDGGHARLRRERLLAARHIVRGVDGRFGLHNVCPVADGGELIGALGDVFGLGHRDLVVHGGEIEQDVREHPHKNARIGRASARVLLRQIPEEERRQEIGAFAHLLGELPEKVRAGLAALGIELVHRVHMLLAEPRAALPEAERTGHHKLIQLLRKTALYKTPPCWQYRFCAAPPGSVSRVSAWRCLLFLPPGRTGITLSLYNNFFICERFFKSLQNA